jgi:hypothetical protein
MSERKIISDFKEWVAENPRASGFFSPLPST